MNTPDTTTPNMTRRERRQRERIAAKASTIRPARQGDMGSYPIPAGSMIVITQLARGIRHKVLITPEGEIE